MAESTSKWLDYPETKQKATDKTDKSPSVSSVTPSKAHVGSKNGATAGGSKVSYVKPAGHASLFDLPFPLGYRGLPEKAVKSALLWCDAKGAADPVEVMLEVCWWVLDHFKQVKYRGPLQQEVRARAKVLWTDLTGSDEDPYCDECPGQPNA